MTALPTGLEVVLDLGFGVFPCRAVYETDDRKEKAPLTDHGKDDASRDKAQIRDWAARHPGCAWGARPPAEITVLDIDVKSGISGFATLHGLEERRGELPPTLTNLTASGGQHRLFRTDGTVFKNRAGVLPGLDVRSATGYILVPPSAILPKGCKDWLPYRWQDPRQALATAPGWLIAEIFAKEKSRDHSAPITQGERNDALISYAGLLRAQDVPHDDAWTLMLRRNEEAAPPVSLPELRRILDNAYKYLAGDMLVGVDEDVRELIERERPSSIILPNDNLQISYAAERVFRQLGAGRDLFLRGGVIVDLQRDGSLKPLTKEELCSRIEGNGRRRILHVIKANRGKDRPVEHVLVKVQCSPNTAGLLMAAGPQVELLPSLAMVSESALLVEQGGALRLLGVGYHELAGGVLVRGRETPPEVPLQEAVTALLGLFEEFHFTAEADRARALAHLIGPALRFGALVKGHALMSTLEAKQSQTGKGYLAKLMRVPYGAEAYEVVQRTGGVGSLDETLAEAILAGHPFIAFENVRGRLNSPLLEHAFTSHEKYPVRVPHKATVRCDISRTMFQLTSNGVEGTVDLANRMLLVRLEKHTGEFKLFPEGDLLAHVQARATYFLGCIFAVVRAWHAAGKPALPTAHSFRQWVGTLDWIGQKVLGLRPLLEGHAAALQRVANPGLSWLRVIAGEVIRRKWNGRELSATELMEVGNDVNCRVAENDDEAKQVLAVGRRMHEAFKDAPSDTITVESVPVRRMEFTDNEGRKRWRYVFGEAVEL